MPAVQTTYGGTHSQAYAGLIGNSEVSNTISRLVTVASGFALGVAVFQAPAVDNGVTNVPGTPFRGISATRNTLYGNNAFPTPDFYFQGATAEIITKGTVWVTAAASTSSGAPAYYDGSSNITSTASGNTQILNAFFDTSTAAGALVLLRLGA